MKKWTAEQLLSTQAIRQTTEQVFEFCMAGDGHFEVDLEQLPRLAQYIVNVIHDNYPSLDIPYHSRWGHFRAGGEMRLKLLMQELESFDPLEQARRQIDLVIPSVLLDAGAGPDWKFLEPETNFEIGRSEGLGLASFYMFLAGDFSSSLSDLLRADAAALKETTADKVSEGFQVSEKNPLVGLEGRAQLVRSLGECIERQSQYFVGARPGGLVDYWQQQFGKSIPANEILKSLLYALGPIWPSRLSLDNLPLGDVWQHSKVGMVAFHKLSQWLSYSLIEPLEWAGFEVTRMDELTGLAEYRNGGLFVDGGVLRCKQDLNQKFLPQSDVIIEWRALTVQLLDRIAPLVRSLLQKTPEDLPLAKVLEGGTWWAGRKLARERCPNGEPPIQIQSDGTVF